MLCPACSEPMLVLELHRIELDHCVACRGLWLDSEELDVLFRECGADASAAGFEQGLAALPGRAADGRKCPRCRRKLVEVDAPVRPEPVALDRCPHGDGVWFDCDELPRLLAGSISEDAPALRSVREFLGKFADPKEG